MIPGLRGPGGKIYIFDHHHYALALLRAGISRGYVDVIVDWSHLSLKAFWEKMESVGWAHPYDKNGIYQGVKAFTEIRSLEDMENDEYRSLAGFVRDAGGFDKVEVPYSEFLWADFFRSQFSKKDLRNHFDEVTEKAVKLARSSEAQHLPGWRGK